MRTGAVCSAYEGSPAVAVVGIVQLVCREI